MKIFIGSIRFSATPDELEEFFADHGVSLTNVAFINNHDTGEFRGFAFAEVNIPRERQSALDLDGQTFKGRALCVNLAEDKPRRER